MTAPGLAARPETAAGEAAEPAGDNPPRMLHAVCPHCYPVIPPAGTPVVRWCGQVVTIKPDGVAIEGTVTAPPDACIICADLSSCATCGALRTFFGVLPPDGAPT